MFHLVAHYGSIGNTANTGINAITDVTLSIRNNHITPGRPMMLRAALGFGAELLRVRNNSARVRAVSPNYLPQTLHAAALPVDVPVVDMMNNPFRIDAAEELIWEVSNDAVGPTDTYVLNWLYETMQPAPQGEIFTIRGTSTTASVANAWTAITMSWDFQLPAGRYAIVGGQYYAATGLAFRTVIDGQVLRPGGVANVQESARTWDKQLNGGLGLWGIFDTVTLPNIEVLNGGAVAVHTIYLQVVRLP